MVHNFKVKTNKIYTNILIFILTLSGVIRAVVFAGVVE